MVLSNEEWEIICSAFFMFQQVILQQTHMFGLVATYFVEHRQVSSEVGSTLFAKLFLLRQTIELAFSRDHCLLSHNYIEPRSREWSGWYLMHVIEDDPIRFKNFFRVSPATFVYICDLLRGDLTTQPPPGLRNLTNRTLSVERQVAIALRRFASGCLLLTLSEMFGVSVPCISDVIWQFVKALIRHARGTHLSWPQGEAMAQVKEEFRQLQGFPNCCGAIDATHFQVELPLGTNSIDYRDYRRGQSISMQAVCDSRLRFLDVFAGWPGSIQDSCLLRVSGFFNDVVGHHTKLSGPVFTAPSGFTTGEYIIGDAGYPVFPWLLNPFPAVGEHTRKSEFNYMLSSTRMCVERAFGQLKNSWRFVSRRMFRPHPYRLAHYITCACLLHNIRIDCGDVYDPAWGLDADPPYEPGGPPAVHLNYNNGRSYRIAMMDHLLPEREWEHEQRTGCAAHRDNRP